MDSSRLTTPVKAALSKRGWTVEALAASLPVDHPSPSHLPLNGLCHTDAWDDPEWRQFARALGLPQEEGWYHRKAWEWTQCIYGLERLHALGDGVRVLGVGAGHECVLYYLANRSSQTVATDLYAGDFASGGASEADPTFLRDPAYFAPFPYKSDHLDALPADGCALPFADRSFDVAYSLSSIEHFGGHAKAADAMREIARILRPGGIACVATELVISGGPHPEYFTWEDLDHWVIGASGLVPVEAISRTLPPQQYVDDPVRLPEEASKTPHVVVADGPWTFTSVAIFLRKPTRSDLARGASYKARRQLGSIPRKLRERTHR